MQPLKDRLEEVMRHMRWQHADLVRISHQSSSVVSQWLGKGSKEIKTIGKLEAAIYIERASGFSALWVAKGFGPRKVAAYPAAHPAAAALGERPPPPYDPADLLQRFGTLLAAAPAANLPALADVLRGWALDAGAPERRPVLLALITPSA